MKANHNSRTPESLARTTVSNGSKILKWKQITTRLFFSILSCNCFQWFKDTKMKANHNSVATVLLLLYTVSNGSKILKWKQITTRLFFSILSCNCFQWFKDTKMKANHNSVATVLLLLYTVSNGSKILKWKQITTIDKFFFVKWLLFPMVQRY